LKIGSTKISIFRLETISGGKRILLSLILKMDLRLRTIDSQFLKTLKDSASYSMYMNMVRAYATTPILLNCSQLKDLSFAVLTNVGLERVKAQKGKLRAWKFWLKISKGLTNFTLISTEMRKHHVSSLEIHWED